jgi:mxaJ protein
VIALTLAVGWLAPSATSAGADQAGALRVCADPDNRPFSSEKSGGFENQIAEVVARDLGRPLAYVWWPHQRGLVRRVLNTGQCDVLIGVPRGYGPVLTTKPYYRTAYVVASLRGRDLRITSLDDRRLRQIRVGVHINTPPSVALGLRGVSGANVVGYPLFFDSRHHPEDYPGKVIEDLVAGMLDVAIVWGPIAGYFAKKEHVPLDLAPLESGDPRLPFSFAIAMGVRKDDTALKAALDGAIDRRGREIRSILEAYGVPLLAEVAETDPDGSPSGGHQPPHPGHPPDQD